MEKISACLIVHNEEKLIGRALESLRGVVDEIIVIHDGECSDRTLEIAREYGAKVFVRPFVGCSEGHLFFGYEEAVNNWILQIDADEFLSSELREELPHLINDLEISAFELLWPLWDGKRESRALWPYKRCLFRKDRISTLGITHFVVEVNGKIKKVNLKLHHQPAYNNFSLASFLKKQLPWARLQASYYLQEFSDIKKFNYAGTDWPRSVKWRQKYPLLLLPLEFLVVSIKNIFSGAYRAGSLGLIVSFRAGLYRAAVNYYLYKLKK